MCCLKHLLLRRAVEGPEIRSLPQEYCTLKCFKSRFKTYMLLLRSLFSCSVPSLSYLYMALLITGVGHSCVLSAPPSHVCKAKAIVSPQKDLTFFPFSSHYLLVSSFVTADLISLTEMGNLAPTSLVTGWLNTAFLFWCLAHRRYHEAQRRCLHSVCTESMAGSGWYIGKLLVGSHLDIVSETGHTS